MRQTLISIVIALLGSTALVLGNDTVDTTVQQLPDSIVVTASRAPSTFSEVTRSVTVIHANELQRTPSLSVADLLIHVPGVDVRRRSVHGVQADIGIRGATSSQTLVLLNGVRIADPQTSHHSFDLPVTPSDIQRIEVLRGGGSRLYGPDAFGGVINVITSQAVGRDLRLSLVQGQHRLSEQTVSAVFPAGPVSHRLSLARRTSEGHRDNTEFDIKNLSYTAGARTGASSFDFSAQYVDKEFGAHRFYSDAFPDEWEATSSLVLSGGGHIQAGLVTLSPRLIWRRHKDDFVLDSNRPDWYRNRHTTDLYGAELQAGVESAWGTTTVAGEVSREEITSSNLGDHSRDRGGLLVEHSVKIGAKVALLPGAAVYWHEGFGWQVWPGLDVGYRTNEWSRLFVTVGRSYRIPNYTDLYYVSPANMGNPDLSAEKAWTYEAGAAVDRGLWSARASVFTREGRDLIDWARSDASDPWQVLNVSRVTTSGLELSFTLTPGVESPILSVGQVGLAYTYLDSDRSTGNFDSKYLLDHLSHQANFSFDLTWLELLENNWRVRYQERLQGSEAVVVDARLAFDIYDLGIFVEASNLFNEAYSEIGTVPMPGRWVWAGLSYSLSSR